MHNIRFALRQPSLVTIAVHTSLCDDAVPLNAIGCSLYGTCVANGLYLESPAPSMNITGNLAKMRVGPVCPTFGALEQTETVYLYLSSLRMAVILTFELNAVLIFRESVYRVHLCICTSKYIAHLA
jgi:hypothetical protein